MFILYISLLFNYIVERSLNIIAFFVVLINYLYIDHLAGVS